MPTGKRKGLQLCSERRLSALVLVTALSHVRRNVGGDGPNLRIGERQLREGLPRFPWRSARPCGAVRSVENSFYANLADSRDDQILSMGTSANTGEPGHLKIHMR